MLKKVNFAHKILVKYLQMVNPNDETGVLLEIETGSSMPTKNTKSDEDHVKTAKSKSSPKMLKVVIQRMLRVTISLRKKLFHQNLEFLNEFIGNHLKEIRLMTLRWFVRLRLAAKE